jgi:hypothetical protein
LLILFRLTIDTQAHARDSLTAGSGDGGVAFFTVLQAFAPGQPITRAIDSVLDCGVDLVLYRTVFCKAASHSLTPWRQLHLLLA